MGGMRWISLGLLLSLSLACVEEPKPDSSIEDNFDRSAMLEFWADEIIIPAYANYVAELEQFDSLNQHYQQSLSAIDLQALQAQYDQAYQAWQWVSIYEIGPAETASLRNYTNVYPCDTSELISTVASGNYNLGLPSTFDIQGWPAIDYLLFAPIDLSAKANLRAYLQDLSQRLLTLSNGVLQAWQGSYRQDFISNAGSSADASVNKLINDFVYHYEKELRAGKIGIPAGVFSGMPLANRAEALYREDFSRSLFFESLEAHRRFFGGISFDSLSTGPSLNAYLDYLKIENNNQLLSDAIENQFLLVQQQAGVLDQDLSNAAVNQTADMLQTFDVLQQNVIWLKVDMMQALNVRVDYVDADGD